MFEFGFGQSSSLFGQPSSTAGGNSLFGANAANPSSGSTTLMQTTGSSSILGGNSTSLFCATLSASSPSSASFTDINAPPSLFTNKNAPPLAGGSSLFGTVNSTAHNNSGFGGGSSTGSGGGSSLFGERPAPFVFKTTASGSGSSLFGERPTSFVFKTTVSGGGSSIFEVKPTSSGFNFGITRQQQSQPAPFTGFGPSNSSIAPSTSSSSPFSSFTGFNSSNSSTPLLFNSSNSRTSALSGTSNGIGSGAGIVAYTPTSGKDGSQEITMSFQSISAMPYAHKSHEELRGGDYQSGDKGGPRSFYPASSNTNANANANANALFASKPNLRQTSPTTQFAPSSTTSGSLQKSSPSVFSPSNTNNPFAPSGTQGTISSSSSAFRPSSSSIFGFFNTSSATTTNTTPPFNAQPVEPTNALEPTWTHSAPPSTSQCSGESATVYGNGDDLMAVLPKLRFPDYYTEPNVQELAAKERAQPGFCSRVKDFVVGRHGFGNIKFLGETDVRGLDLYALVQFNYGEVFVSKKLPSREYLISLPYPEKEG